VPSALLLPLIDQARRSRFALPSFNVFNMETALAVVEAAEQERSPVVVAVAELHFPFTDFELLSSMLVRLAERATVPVVLHLDHAQTLDVVVDAMRYGFTSFQFDGYGIPFEERIRLTRSVVDLAHSAGFAVEAELGHVTRVGTDAERRDQLIANVDEATRFSEATGIDVMAAAVGNVHGLRDSEGSIDFELIRRLAAAIQGTLSLHGGSGLSATDVARAVELGVAKVSYYNNLGRAANEAMRAVLGSEDPAFTDVMAAARGAYAARAAERIRVFGASGQADASSAGVSTVAVPVA
jgi:fructose-bisphosphate aldolase class II